MNYRERLRRTAIILSAIPVALMLIGLLAYDTFFWPTVIFFGLMSAGIWLVYWMIVWAVTGHE